ncbi:hypothetical protein SAMN04488012_101456 [Palleronia salina]|uniref:Uncharacterized protein n=2 Tax=Palleronia salina TaxID=313368 RepID=A0A1M6BE06_9RHOB|nr:hypothetical protein SAMN04488012_101456 [Palleronia salina]
MKALSEVCTAAISRGEAPETGVRSVGARSASPALRRERGVIARATAIQASAEIPMPASVRPSRALRAIRQASACRARRVWPTITRTGPEKLRSAKRRVSAT